MNAAIDIGNQRVKLALFEGDSLLRQDVEETGNWKGILTWSTNHLPENVIMSSVGPLPGPELEDELRSRSRFMRLEADTPLPIENRYSTPGTLGKDRLAALVGAFHHYPGENCLVVDAGTCITCDLIDASGVFQGGSISPGISMRLKAMHAFTARLPLLGPAPLADWLGRDTDSAMRSGAQYGAALEVEGFAVNFAQRFGQLRLVGTGGDLEILAKALKSKIFVHQQLVLEGLNKILTYNVEHLA